MKQHDQFEKFAKQWFKNYHAADRTIYCRKGCAGCCSLAVHATYPEAVAVINVLSEQQSKKLTDYVERTRNALPQAD